MSQGSKHEVLILAFGEMPDDDWEQIVEREVALLQSKLDEVPNRWLAGSAETIEIGRGADWLVLGLYFVIAGLAIPEAHKKIREHLEEWKRIYAELHQLFSRVIGKREALYPDAYLFLVGVNHVLNVTATTDIEFKSMYRLPEGNPDLAERGALLFTFALRNTLFQVAVARNSAVLWANELEL